MPAKRSTHGREYVARMGWKLDREIFDEGRSAFHGTNRSEGAALHEFEQEARNGLHRDITLCVENLDRLSRQGAKATAQLVWALNEQGVSIATWHDGYIYRPGNTDMMELFSVIIKAQLAHEESLKKSQRTKASWAKVHRDISEGSKKIVPSRWPAWLEVHDDKYRPISERAALLNEIFELYANGTGIYRIVQMLNEREEPVWQFGKRRTGNGWYLPYVHRLLTNRGVIGEYVTLKGETLALDYYPQVVAPD